MVASLKKNAVTRARVVTALICLTGLFASAANAQCLTSSQTGTNNGFYYSFWKDSPGTVNFCLQAGGRYTSNWSGINNWVGGKGWQTGSRRVVNYSGSFNSPGNGYLDSLRVDHQSARRVLHRRQLGHVSPAGWTGLHGHRVQRWRHV